MNVNPVIEMDQSDKETAVYFISQAIRAGRESCRQGVELSDKNINDLKAEHLTHIDLLVKRAFAEGLHYNRGES